MTSEDGAGRYASLEADDDEAKPKEKHTVSSPILAAAALTLEEDLNE